MSRSVSSWISLAEEFIECSFCGWLGVVGLFFVVDLLKHLGNGRIS